MFCIFLKYDNRISTPSVRCNPTAKSKLKGKITCAYKQTAMITFSTGWQKIRRARMPKHMTQHKNFAISDGPHSCIIITNGFLKRRRGNTRSN
jgi:hypothetical protein